MYQGDQNSLPAILQGGNNMISKIMDQAIQIGRDMSNKQMQQERDLLGMRAQENALAQRRAENLQQNIEDAQRFARNAYEFDTKFGADQAYRQQALARQAKQDAIGNSLEERRLNLSELASKREDRKLSFDEQRTKASYERTAAEQQAQQEASQGLARDRALMTSGVEGKVVSGVPGAESVPILGGILGEDISVSQKSDAAQSVLANPRASASDIEFARGVLDPSLRSSGSGARPTDPNLIRSRELTVAEKEQKFLQKEVTSLVESNADAFPRSYGSYEDQLRKIAAKEGKKPEEILYSDKVSEKMRKGILEQQKGQVTIELNAINNAPSEDAYVDKLPGAAPAQQEVRRKLYRLVKGGASAAGPQEAADPDAWMRVKPY
jgi:hypothetical protein